MGHSVQRTSFLSVTEAPDTYVCVRIVELHHNVGRRGHRHLWVAKNLHLVEDERLIPGGIEGVSHSHGFLRLVEERDNGVGVWGETAPSVSLRQTTDFKHHVCLGQHQRTFYSRYRFSDWLHFAVTAVSVYRAKLTVKAPSLANTACSERCPADWKQAHQRHWQHKAVGNVCLGASKQTCFFCVLF